MNAAIGHNNPPMDFGDFFDLVTDSPASAHEKLVKLVIARLAQKAGGKVAPRRVEILYKASCSEATFKRSFSSLKEFFDINPKKGHKTEYAPKRQLTAYDVEAAARAVCEKTRDHSDTYSENKASELRVSEIPTSEPSSVQEVRTRDHCDTELKKEIPPTPPKEKNNNIYTPSQPSSPASAKAGVGEVEGINGATSLIVSKLAGWINPLMPDHRTARGWLESSVAMYGGTVVRDSFAELEAKVMQGDVIARPIPLLTKICQRRKAEPPGKGQAVDQRLKGLPEKFRRDIEAKRGPQ